MMEYTLKEDLLYLRDSIVAFFEIEPVDIYLLSKEEQATFFARLHQTFSVLEEQIQINVLVRESSIEDYNPHFNSLLKQAVNNPHKLSFVQNIIEDLREVIEDPEEKLFTRKFYFQIKQNCDPDSEIGMIQGIEKLDQKVQKISGALFRAGLEIKQVTGKELQIYIKSYYA